MQWIILSSERQARSLCLDHRLFHNFLWRMLSYIEACCWFYPGVIMSAVSHSNHASAVYQDGSSSAMAPEAGALQVAAIVVLRSNNKAKAIDYSEATNAFRHNSTFLF